MNTILKMIPAGALLAATTLSISALTPLPALAQTSTTSCYWTGAFQNCTTKTCDADGKCTITRASYYLGLIKVPYIGWQ